ncbi:ROK family protein [Gordonia sp. CPCC 206044]|uniref:ROK family transcriptional regulator n=1 Tax=Gordonia sp. CPCC 206044 TaxID=3140793 RepID=UPI003AF3C463
MTSHQTGAASARWLTAARLIDLLRTHPDITRAAAAAELGIGSGAATDLLARLRRAELVDEVPAPARGRGRPTTLLRPHPRGPLVIAADLGATGWRVATADVGGAPVVEAAASRLHRDPRRVLGDMAEAIRVIQKRDSSRIRLVSVAAAGTVSDDRLVQFTPRGWMDVDLSQLTSGLPRRVHLPMSVGNDATLAGLAEARTGSARGVGTVLHLIVTTGIGGALIVDGVPTTGAHGAAGEYGHLPFGDRTQLCACGAHGCWNLTVAGDALADLRGDPPPRNPVAYAHRLLDRASGTDASAGHAFTTVARSLGSGIAGLVNVHDPDVVTLGGLASPLRAAATGEFDSAYLGGLMAFRKNAPPPVLDGIHGDDGPLVGAALLGLDRITTPDALAQWAESS